MRDTTKPTYIVHAQAASIFLRHRCGICGGSTDKDDIEYTYRDTEGDEHFVCDRCIADGIDAFPAKLRTQAQDLRAWADDLDRDASQRWQFDTESDARARREAQEWNRLAG